MGIEELEIIDDSFELKSQIEGEVKAMPIMDKYPSHENTFDVMSSAEGVDPDLISGAVTAVAGMVSTVAQNKNEAKQQLKARCGRKPLFAKNRGTYNKCVEQFYLGSGGGVNKSTPTNTPTAPIYYPPMPEPKRGLSTGATVGIVLGVVALGVGGYFLFKKMKKG